jgi:hypothetical protein
LFWFHESRTLASHAFSSLKLESADQTHYPTISADYGRTEGFFVIEKYWAFSEFLQTRSDSSQDQESKEFLSSLEPINGGRHSV